MSKTRLYDHLFLKENPDEEQGEDFTMNLNPHSLEVLEEALVEPALTEAAPGNKYQFLRQGYFCVDEKSSATSLVFNRVVSLKDSWGKMKNK